MKKNTNKIATTIKIERELYEDFKILGVKSHVTLQTLVEKCVYRYMGEEAFRKDMDAHVLPLLSTTGSITLSV